MAAPSLTELAAVAERTIGFLQGEGQVTALWERRLSPAGVDIALKVTVTCVAEGRCWRTEASGTDDDALRRAAKAAALRARQTRAWPSAGLPDPAPGRPHDGFDAGLLTAAPRELSSRLETDDWHAAATRIAIASTRGVRAVEQRSYVALGGLAAVGAAALGREPAELARSERMDTARRAPADVPGEISVVLGPRAVAQVLDRLRSAFGVDLALGTGSVAGRLGTHVAAPSINLSDSALHPGTLPRSYDAEGVPRQPVRLIQDGVAHRGVHDTASAARAGEATTGHATQAATLAPMPDHLVLAGGGASGVDELLAAMHRPIYLPTLHGVEVDPLAVLSSAEALTSAQWVVALRSHCPGGSGAAVVPGLRASAGVRVDAGARS